MLSLLLFTLNLTLISNDPADTTLEIQFRPESPTARLCTKPLPRHRRTSPRLAPTTPKHVRFLLLRLVLHVVFPQPTPSLQPLLHKPRRLDMDPNVRRIYRLSSLHRRFHGAPILSADA